MLVVNDRYVRRQLAIACCLEACRTDVLRTDEEHAAVREAAREGAVVLGLDSYEEVKELLAREFERSELLRKMNGGV